MMDNSMGPLDSLEDFIVCSICLEKFEDPRSLPCLHAFCLNCIQSIHQAALQKDLAKQHEIKCPKCLEVASVPGGDLTKLPKYFQAAQVGDVVEDIKKNMDAKKDHSLCTLCTGRPKITEYCFTCNVSMCTSCVLNHYSSERLKSHVRISVSEDDIEHLVCQEHDIWFEMYCTDCCQPICKKCKAKTHTDHVWKGFCLKNVPYPMEDASHALIDLETTLEQLNAKKEDFNAHIVDVHKELKDNKQRIIDQIGERYDKLCTELSCYQSENNNEIEQMQREVTDSKELINDNVRRQQSIMQPFPNISGIGLEDSSVLLKQLAMPQTEFVLPELKMFQFVPQARDPSVGHIFTWTSKLQVDRVQDLDVFDSGDILVIIDCPKPVIKMYNSKGIQQCLPFKVSYLRSPQCVAIHRKTSAVVFSEHPQFTLLGYKNYLTLFTLKNEKWNYSWFTSKTVTTDLAFLSNGNILVISSNNPSIHRYEQTGKVIWTNPLDHACYHIGVDQNDQILISSESQIHVYDSQFSNLMTFPVYPKPTSVDALGFIPPDLAHTPLNPKAIGCDGENNIFVVDGISRRIVVFSAEGVHLADLVEIRGEPTSFVIHMGRYLVVSTRDNGIFVLEIDPLG